VVDRPADRGKRQIGARQTVKIEQPYFFTLRTCRNLRRQEACTKEQLQLTDVIEAVECEQIDDLELRARFFPSLARSAFLGALPHLHEPCGKGPVPLARLDRAPAHEQLILPRCNDPDDHLGVLISDVVAIWAN